MKMKASIGTTISVKYTYRNIIIADLSTRVISMLIYGRKCMHTQAFRKFLFT